MYRLWVSTLFYDYIFGWTYILKCFCSSRSHFIFFKNPNLIVYLIHIFLACVLRVRRLCYFYVPAPFPESGRVRSLQRPLIERSWKASRPLSSVPSPEKWPCSLPALKKDLGSYSHNIQEPTGLQTQEYLLSYGSWGRKCVLGITIPTLPTSFS